MKETNSTSPTASRRGSQTKLFYATTNVGKVAAMQRNIAHLPIKLVQAAFDLPEPRSSDVAEIARHKAHLAYEQLQAPVIVHDSGFYIPSLNGFPRAFVNFALETIGIEGILRLAAGKDRACEFVVSLAYMDSQQPEPRCFHGHYPGQLATEIRGAAQPHQWSPLWHIFVPAGETQTLNEMTQAQFLTWTTAADAAGGAEPKFVAWLASQQVE